MDPRTSLDKKSEENLHPLPTTGIEPGPLSTMSYLVHSTTTTTIVGESVSGIRICVPMPTHCTIKYFGFRAKQIDGAECGLFSIHAPLGHTTLRVRRVSV